MIGAELPLAYLVALDLAGRHCVVIGGGDVATRRVGQLLDAGARVTVVAERLDATVAASAARGDVAWVPRAYRSGDLDGAAVAFNAETGRDLEERVHHDARLAHVLLNTHDRPAACDFASPALVRRGRLQIAVSTSGDSPHVAATVRERLESMFGPEWGAQLSVLATVRRRLRQKGTPGPVQQHTYRLLMRRRVREALRRRHDPSPLIEASTADTNAIGASVGTVHLVGAGPGDPGLLTLAARDLLLEADVVFHDALVSPEILAMCGARARLVDVGKRGGGAQIDQNAIITMLIDAAMTGADVVRLKGGDPFVFGRGGEELKALRAAGIDADVVPGISAALAAPAAAGIPMTFRGVASSVAIVSGHSAAGEMDPDLARIAAAVETIVVLMPLRNIELVVARLLETLAPSTPAAMICGATTAEERVARAPLGEIASVARAARLPAPATLVVGRVVDILAGASVPAHAAAASQGA